MNANIKAVVELSQDELYALRGALNLTIEAGVKAGHYKGLHEMAVLRDRLQDSIDHIESLQG